MLTMCMAVLTVVCSRWCKKIDGYGRCGDGEGGKILPLLMTEIIFFAYLNTCRIFPSFVGYNMSLPA